MKTFWLYMFMMMLPLASPSAVTEQSDQPELTIKGLDVRKKTDQYILILGSKSALLEERTYRLMKKSGSRYTTVQEGVVTSIPPQSEDHSELYSNDKILIRFGKPVTVKSRQKQIIVAKLRDSKPGLERTIAFENYQD